MADMISEAGKAVETLAFGSETQPGLPQMVPQGAGPRTGYDRLVDAVNRLPRPVAALLALGMFLDAALDPTGFAQRMEALSAIPEPLWWVLGGVLTFFFGARETHYLRHAGEAGKPKG